VFGNDVRFHLLNPWLGPLKPTSWQLGCPNWSACGQPVAHHLNKHITSTSVLQQAGRSDGGMSYWADCVYDTGLVVKKSDWAR
jgi:hypothetical protein